MFIKVRNDHDYSIDPGKNNQYISVIPFRIHKIQYHSSKKKQQGINGGKHVKSLTKPAFKYHDKRPLGTAAEAFNS